MSCRWPLASACTDFGIAFSSDMPRLTQHGQFIGTVEYTAPEVIRGEDATRASDVYSFGVLAYEALTGRLPLAPWAPLAAPPLPPLPAVAPPLEAPPLVASPAVAEPLVA